MSHGDYDPTKMAQEIDALRDEMRRERELRARAEAQRDELESWHTDEKTWRIGAEQERDDVMQRVRALEDDCETAGAAMGAVCVLATVRPGEKYAGPIDHAAVAAVVGLLAERDGAIARAEEADRWQRDYNFAIVRAEKAEAARQLAEAGAASLREALCTMVNYLGHDGQDHEWMARKMRDATNETPAGAEMLARMKLLEQVAEIARSVLAFARLGMLVVGVTDVRHDDQPRKRKRWARS